MRGKAKAQMRHNLISGITPAYAGKSTTWYRPDIEAKDHPRLCGEKRRFASLWLPVVGSPPPMRGKAFEKGYDKYTERITPA